MLCPCPSQGCDLEQFSLLPCLPSLRVNEDIDISFSWLELIGEGVPQYPDR